ncbi:autotransporter domain-containing protein [Salmonella enterica]|nr:autotransporter domain-containing protein [Salmonella enterica]EGH9933902.1 autotransporter domain-containing protein [Salmonella enterica]EGM0353587.1 autotransporter domain-containing protein [Salmonella enterica]
MRITFQTLFKLGVFTLFANSAVAETTPPEYHYDKTQKLDGAGLPFGISNDGTVIVGQSDDYQATVWLLNDNSKYYISTEKPDKKFLSSQANSISGDGTVIVGISNAGSGNSCATAWIRNDNESYSNVLTLDTTDSTANDVSTDGSVIVGARMYNQYASAWLRNDDGKGYGKELTLDNSADGSQAYGVSGDGAVIVGMVGSNASVWLRNVDGESYSTTLALNNGADGSTANSVSGDGAVIVGSVGLHASAWLRKPEGKTYSNTLLLDNSTNLSEAKKISADGAVIVGDTDFHASAWLRNADGKTYSNTLMLDDSKNDSEARGVSADGSVIVGTVGEHAALWKLEKNTDTPVPEKKPDDTSSPEKKPDDTSSPEKKPDDTSSPEKKPDDSSSPEKKPDDTSTHEQNPQVILVDVTNSSGAMADTARRSFNALSLYQNEVNTLANTQCRPGEKNTCVGIMTHYSGLKGGIYRLATGLHGAFRLPDPHWVVGGAISFANRTRLMKNYTPQGSHQPGVGLFTQYQSSMDGTGVNVGLSAAYLNQSVRITRDQWKDTEAGSGDSRINAYQMGIDASYGIKLSDTTFLSPDVGVTYHKVSRDGYTETHGAKFPASYGRMVNTRTDLQLGMDGSQVLNDTVQLNGGIGTRIRLSGHQDAFSGKIDWIGAYAYDRGANNAVQPYARVSISLEPLKNATLGIGVSWTQTDYGKGVTQVGMSYNYRW